MNISREGCLNKYHWRITRGKIPMRHSLKRARPTRESNAERESSKRKMSASAYTARAGRAPPPFPKTKENLLGFLKGRKKTRGLLLRGVTTCVMRPEQKNDAKSCDIMRYITTLIRWFYVEGKKTKNFNFLQKRGIMINWMIMTMLVVIIVVFIIGSSNSPPPLHINPCPYPPILALRVEQRPARQTQPLALTTA